MSATAAESAEHPVIAVVDRAETATVVWHVQTDPAFSSVDAVMSGAWVLSEDDGDVAPGRLAELLAGTQVLLADAADPAAGPAASPDGAAGVLPGAGAEGVDALAAAVNAEVDKVSAAVAEYREANPKAAALRLSRAEAEDPRWLASAYHGEAVGQRAWSVAKAVAGVVEQWHAVENQRRSRAFLKEAFGPAVRPLPLQGA